MKIASAQWCWLALALAACGSPDAPEAEAPEAVDSAEQPLLTDAPYPASKAISGVSFDFSKRDRRAQQADNWPVTWAADGEQYTSWGDGWGFRSSSDAKISLGVSRVSGSATGHTDVDVWEGDPQGSNLPNDGKSYGILAVGNTLFMWVSPGSGRDAYEGARVWRSTTSGASWSKATWAFTRDDGIINPVFLQRGQGYADSDGYVYMYAAHLAPTSTTGLSIQKPGKLTLMRVPKASIMTRSEYTFFNGRNSDGSARWTAKFAERDPVFVDPNGVSWATGSVSYNRGRNRYLLITEHAASSAGKIGIFDAPAPWGPWTTVHYASSFGSGVLEQTTFYWNFSNKWASSDGLSFVLVFSGTKTNDSWNTVPGRLIP